MVFRPVESAERKDKDEHHRYIYSPPLSFLADHSAERIRQGSRESENQKDFEKVGKGVGFS